MASRAPSTPKSRVSKVPATVGEVLGAGVVAPGALRPATACDTGPERGVGVDPVETGGDGGETHVGSELDRLAERIRAGVRENEERSLQLRKVGIEFILCAAELGKLLNEARAAVRRGGWQEWVRSRCGIEPRTARNYLRVYTEWPQVQGFLESDRKPDSGWTLKGLLRLLSEPPDDASGEPPSPVASRHSDDASHESGARAAASPTRPGHRAGDGDGQRPHGDPGRPSGETPAGHPGTRGGPVAGPGGAVARERADQRRRRPPPAPDGAGKTDPDDTAALAGFRDQVAEAFRVICRHCRASGAGAGRFEEAWRSTRPLRDRLAALLGDDSPGAWRECEACRGCDGVADGAACEACGGTGVTRSG